VWLDPTTWMKGAVDPWHTHVWEGQHTYIDIKLCVTENLMGGRASEREREREREREGGVFGMDGTQTRSSVQVSIANKR
jgi:hypothetical protein